MNYKFFKKYFLALAIVLLVFGARLALASSPYINLEAAVSDTGLKSYSNPVTMIAGIVKVILQLLGLALIVVLVYAGALWGFFSQGDPAKIKKAKEIITNALIGLLLVFASYSITIFIINRFGEISATS